MTQKSWPSGAPARAAATCIADTPGTTRTGRRAEALAIALDRLVDGGRHGEDAGVARGDDGHARAAERELERLARALELDAVVARAALLAAARRHASEVGRVADEHLGPRQRGVGLRRQPSGARRAEARRCRGSPAPAARAGSSPGTSTSDMYGHAGRVDVAERRQCARVPSSPARRRPRGRRRRRARRPRAPLRSCARA